MKLLVVGRNPQESDIVLASDYVSNYHAEIILLDNGDIFIVDKSTNGTYLNGIRLVTGKETPINRGDNVVFADVPLDWSSVPTVNMPKGVKQIRNIGSHFMNDVSIRGPKVSRFHASLRQMSDGKWYICDHSKNGTSVNGRRLIKDQYVLLKKGDQISCAGVPVQNPVKHGSGAAFLAICAAVACLVLGVFVGIRYISNNKTLTDQELCKKNETSIVMMLCGYHFKVECGLLDISKLPDPDSYNYRTRKYSRKLYDEFVLVNGEIFKYNGENSTTFTGTGFFIGEEGYIATNRHIAKPWETETLQIDSKWVTIQEAAEGYFRNKLNKLRHQGYYGALEYISQVKVKGVMDNVVIVPNGDYIDERNAYNCSEIICGENQDEDVAIFKIRSTTLTIPPRASYIPLNKIKAIEPSLGMHIMTIGFPFGLMLQDYEDAPITANYAGGEISRQYDKYSFGFTGASYQGASGSPVFDSKGNVVGVLNARINGTQGFNFAIRAEYLEKLIIKAGINK